MLPVLVINVRRYGPPGALKAASIDFIVYKSFAGAPSLLTQHGDVCWSASTSQDFAFLLVA